MFGEIEPNLEKIEKVQLEQIPRTYGYGKTIFKATITKNDQIKEIIDLVKQCYNSQAKGESEI